MSLRKSKSKTTIDVENVNFCDFFFFFCKWKIKMENSANNGKLGKQNINYKKENNEKIGK